MATVGSNALCLPLCQMVHFTPFIVTHLRSCIVVPTRYLHFENNYNVKISLIIIKLIFKDAWWGEDFPLCIEQRPKVQRATSLILGLLVSCSCGCFCSGLYG